MQPQTGLRQNGLIFARTRSGIDLPVIDFSNPRFAVPEDPSAVRALYAAFVESERKRRLVPKFIMRRMLRSAANKSLLVRSMFQAKAGFLDSVSTYMMKLGIGNLVPPFDGEIDRKFAASPHVPLIRLRMQQTAHLLSQGLIEDLAINGTAPLDLLNQQREVDVCMARLMRCGYCTVERPRTIAGPLGAKPCRGDRASA